MTQPGRPPQAPTPHYHYSESLTGYVGPERPWAALCGLCRLVRPLRLATLKLSDGNNGLGHAPSRTRPPPPPTPPPPHPTTHPPYHGYRLVARVPRFDLRGGVGWGYFRLGLAPPRIPGHSHTNQSNPDSAPQISATPTTRPKPKCNCYLFCVRKLLAKRRGLATPAEA